MIQRLITRETAERFIRTFQERCDYLKQDGHQVYLTPYEISLLVDAINLYESLRREPFMFSFCDLARLHLEIHEIEDDSF